MLCPRSHGHHMAKLRLEPEAPHPASKAFPLSSAAVSVASVPAGTSTTLAAAPHSDAQGPVCEGVRVPCSPHILTGLGLLLSRVPGTIPGRLLLILIKSEWEVLPFSFSDQEIESQRNQVSVSRSHGF